MATIKIKGHEFAAITVKDSFDRRALQYKNKIAAALRKIGIKEDDVEVELEHVSMKSASASASWYISGHRMHFSYNSPMKYVENLYVVLKVIELEVNSLISGGKAMRDFISEFSEDENVEEKRKEAREILGVAPDSLDLELIDSKYKDLAKKYHPDMPEGDAEKFKEINKAHKVLRRELQ